MAKRSARALDSTRYYIASLAMCCPGWLLAQQQLQEPSLPPWCANINRSYLYSCLESHSIGKFFSSYTLCQNIIHTVMGREKYKTVAGFCLQDQNHQLDAEHSNPWFVITSSSKTCLDFLRELYTVAVVHLQSSSSMRSESTFGVDLDTGNFVRGQRKGVGLLVVALYRKYTIGWKVLKNLTVLYQVYHS